MCESVERLRIFCLSLVRSIGFAIENGLVCFGATGGSGGGSIGMMALVGAEFAVEMIVDDMSAL